MNIVTTSYESLFGVLSKYSRGDFTEILITIASIPSFHIDLIIQALWNSHCFLPKHDVKLPTLAATPQDIL